jgi:hypothetical protein
LTGHLASLRGGEPCLVYGIGDPSTSGVFVPADATDRWIRGLPCHPELFTPSTGMGLSLAIHDGTALAQYLADAISPDDQPEMLEPHEQAHRRLAEKMLEPDLAPAL